MTFKTTLFQALDIRDSKIVADNYEVEDDMIYPHRTNRLDPKDEEDIMVVDLTAYDYGFFRFRDQVVLVNDDGYFRAISLDPDDPDDPDVVFGVTVQRPIKETDL